MAKRRSPKPRTARAEAADASFPEPPSDASGPPSRSGKELTGRFLVTFRKGSEKQAMKELDQRAGVQNVARSSDFNAESVVALAANEKGRVVFDEFGVAVADFDPNQHRQVATAAAAADTAILAVEPEQYKYSSTSSSRLLSASASIPYWQGYRDAIDHFLSRQGSTSAQDVRSLGLSLATDDEGQLVTEDRRIPPTGFGPADFMASASNGYNDSRFGTWGLHATSVLSPSEVPVRFTGSGIRIAILDTGIDTTHPDFSQRIADSMSLVSGLSVEDGNGHGTHTAGTACGPLSPSGAARYGVAPDALIFIGKVLNNERPSARGTDQDIANGIRWAVNQKCDIISMSLGSQVDFNEPFQRFYEQIASEALKAGSLIIAAAGNDSLRSQGILRPVESPANCPSVMAVGGIDRFLGLYDRSNRALNFPGGLTGGHVDIAGPAVAVISSWANPNSPYAVSTGTSMATPHVSGVAALWAQSTGVRGAALWVRITTNSAQLSFPGRDVGNGLVQAPS